MLKSNASLAAQGSGSMEKKFRTKMYESFLVEQGYRPQIDEDGDVRFKSEGLTYYITVDEKDPEFFRIIFPNFWEIEDETEFMRVLIAINHSNSVCKVTKLFSINDNVWASIEAFTASPEDFKDTFSRSISALRNGVHLYSEKMKELTTE